MMDLYVLGIPIVYAIMGTQYREGYVYTMPSVNTSLITFPNGQMATVSSNGQTVQYVVVISLLYMLVFALI